MRAVVQLLTRLTADLRGGTAVEFALILAMVVLAMMGALIAFSDVAIGMWNNIASEVLRVS